VGDNRLRGMHGSVGHLDLDRDVDVPPAARILAEGAGTEIGVAGSP
jgi:hypothetical protein